MTGFLLAACSGGYRMASATWAVRESSGLEGGAPSCPHGQEKHGAADLADTGLVNGNARTLCGARAHACRRQGRAVQCGEANGAEHGRRGGDVGGTLLMPYIRGNV